MYLNKATSLSLTHMAFQQLHLLHSLSQHEKAYTIQLLASLYFLYQSTPYPLYLISVHTGFSSVLYTLLMPCTQHNRRRGPGRPQRERAAPPYSRKLTRLPERHKRAFTSPKFFESSSVSDSNSESEIREQSVSDSDLDFDLANLDSQSEFDTDRGYEDTLLDPDGSPLDLGSDRDSGYSSGYNSGREVVHRRATLPFTDNDEGSYIRGKIAQLKKDGLPWRSIS